MCTNQSETHTYQQNIYNLHTDCFGHTWRSPDHGSLCETNQQMVRLEMDRVVDGIILEDCDVVLLGVKDVFSKIKTANGEQQFKVYKRDDFFRNINPFQSKL